MIDRLTYDHKMSYVRFDVRGQHHLTHQTTIMKFPGSRFVDFIKGNPDFSLGKRIKIDREAKHFEIILDLMRTQNAAYASTLPEGELKELQDELDYYRLPSTLISELIKPPLPMHLASTWIISHYRKHVVNFERPTLLLSSQTIKEINSRGEIMRQDTLMSAFDRDQYDVAILAHESEKEIFKKNVKSIYYNQSAPYGIIRLCLFRSNEVDPILVIQASFYDQGDFIHLLNRSLILVNWYIRDPDRAAEVKSIDESLC